MRTKKAVVAGVLTVGAVTATLVALGPLDSPPRSAPPRVPAAAAGPVGTAELTERLRAHPDDHRAWSALGVAEVEEARRTADPAHYTKAQRALERSLALRPAGPGNTDAMVGMGALANARHDFAGARRWGERVRAARPDLWTVYPVLADAYTQLGDEPAATTAVQRLLDLRPGLAAFTRAAYEFETHGRAPQAAEALERARDVAGTPADVAFCLHRLGELAWERGDAQGALRRYEEALRADPDAHAALAGRAKARAALGRTDAALTDYETVTARVPLPEYVLELGELYESLGRAADARRQYDVLRAELRLFAANGASDDLTLGLFEADHGEPAAAVAALEREWSRRRPVMVADALGWALHRAGRDAEALAYAEKAARYGWRTAPFLYHRGEIERALGRTEEARAHLAEALRLNPHFSPLRAPLAAKALEEL
ncbi:tetratricopeptide repeat protein [Streptomyces sp. NPDC001941]|uniref:tetratricopeptide repeat protein n=1 Tax=Streptomyces sp. NPDC001941 TaxID=3154659 RepID=UPI003333F2CC